MYVRYCERRAHPDLSNSNIEFHFLGGINEMTITGKIITCFRENKEIPLTTNKIAKLLNEEREKIHVYIWRLKKNGIIMEDGKIGREIQYILGDSLSGKIKKGYLQLNNLFENLVKDVSPGNLKKLLSEINLNLIEEINSELIN